MNPKPLYIFAEARARLLVLIHIQPGASLKAWLYQTIFVSLFGDLNGSLAYAIVYLGIFLGIMTIFYKKKIFIRILFDTVTYFTPKTFPPNADNLYLKDYARTVCGFAMVCVLLPWDSLSESVLFSVPQRPISG